MEGGPTHIHVCSTCGATFQRAGHLSRHELRHIGERPFGCSICDLKFARRNRQEPKYWGKEGNNPRDPIHDTEDCFPASRTSASHANDQTMLESCDPPEPATFPSLSTNYPVHHSLFTLADASLETTLQPNQCIAQTNMVRPDVCDEQQSNMEFRWQRNHNNATTQGTRLWDDLNLFSPLYQCHLPNLSMGFFPNQMANLNYEDRCLGQPIDQELELQNHGVPPWSTKGSAHTTQSRPPVPSFCDARSSPDPHEGQGLLFNDFLRKVWTGRSRRHGLEDSSCHLQAHTGAQNQSEGKSIYSPLMGAFCFPRPDCEGGSSVWEAEDLGHVQPLPIETYNRILGTFRTLNKDNGYHMPFAAGEFPSLAACSAFMQLYFENFNFIFPMLHQPTFDPSHILQEFLRRAINLTSIASLRLIGQMSLDREEISQKLGKHGYILKLVDSQYMLYFDLPPTIPTDLLRLRMPNVESLWHAPTAESWNDCANKLGEHRSQDMRDELEYLYKNLEPRRGLDDFAILLLMMAVFRQTVHYSRDCNSDQGSIYHSLTSPRQALNYASERTSETFPGVKYLQALCPERSDAQRSSYLRSVVIHHYHCMRILLLVPLRELFCYCGYRVTSVDIVYSKRRLRSWISQNDTEARLVALHASRLFGYIRNSNMYGYYEGRALMIACLALWIYSENSVQDSNNNNHLDISGQKKQTPGIPIRLDGQLDEDIKEDWLQGRPNMRPYLTGVGSLLDTKGTSRLVNEGARILCTSTIWPMCETCGKSLKLFYRLRCGTDP
ncbi:uncharacterized protein BP01DRAFT_362086 [Aspergillus saccharolyticus JOP 1030-1]|uniref:C2H2-type domain-containing protein n=1 Tax=Aspergillus saccharolyticus JOP 1030-1 TaxID=1450539 RepID=A0A319AVI0_9EURO|nr:hypothetical protein BP01DRAFT_362086 [Aspergillus saccharolyticus JOP 1030-1]PYH50082.1 hypothetical protein BP01DRAFT_362086 [Aspergillus saccharolyticus JOP 1030-1]